MTNSNKLQKFETKEKNSQKKKRVPARRKNKTQLQKKNQNHMLLKN